MVGNGRVVAGAAWDVCVAPSRVADVPAAAALVAAALVAGALVAGALVAGALVAAGLGAKL